VTEYDADICVIGSGAGGAPVAWHAASQGKSVIVLEKGPWLDVTHFCKDELAFSRRSVFTPRLQDEQHLIESRNARGEWQARPTAKTGRSFWNGNLVGGSSNFMSGFFHRLKPLDFHLRSTFGPIEGANLVDWPIGYADLEPWYSLVERLVGVSGQIRPHANLEPRSIPDFPWPPTSEHAYSAMIDEACAALGYHSLRVPRAILSQPALGRGACEYSGYCGSYGCSTGAKGSARVAFLDPALATGRCQVRPHAKVYQLLTNARGRLTHALYFDRDGRQHQVSARVFVLACQAIETSRLLLCSTGSRFPQGLANNHGQVGHNLLFSAGGSGSGALTLQGRDPGQQQAMRAIGPFVNRALDDWYQIQDPDFGLRPVKGGMVEFLLAHPNPIAKALPTRRQNGQLIWGAAWKRQLEQVFSAGPRLNFEVFCDWLPNDDCWVGLASGLKDRWGTPVARVRIGHHSHDLKVGRFLAAKATEVLKQLGASGLRQSISGHPPANLVAGGCRFGEDPASSVLDADCRAHEVDNLYVTDASFMPTGGSVPYTWTIYANALRVADVIARA
jgi:choline dehydrogenase-like flavoprotein